MRQTALSDIDGRRKLLACLDEIRCRLEGQKIERILSYDLNRDCLLEFPGMISFEDTMLSPEGYAIILEDGHCLYLKLTGESRARIGIFELSEEDHKTISSFSRKDFLNLSEYVYGQGHFRLKTEYGFRYARIRECTVKEGSVPDSFASIILILSNRKKLIFQSIETDDKLYTELLPVKLKVTVEKQRSGSREHERVRRYLKKRHGDKSPDNNRR